MRKGKKSTRRPPQRKRNSSGASEKESHCRGGGDATRTSGQKRRKRPIQGTSGQKRKRPVQGGKNRHPVEVYYRLFDQFKDLRILVDTEGWMPTEVRYVKVGQPLDKGKCYAVVRNRTLKKEFEASREKWTAVIDKGGEDDLCTMMRLLEEMSNHVGSYEWNSWDILPSAKDLYKNAFQIVMEKTAERKKLEEEHSRHLEEDKSNTVELFRSNAVKLYKDLMSKNDDIESQLKSKLALVTTFLNGNMLMALQKHMHNSSGREGLAGLITSACQCTFGFDAIFDGFVKVHSVDSSRSFNERFPVSVVHMPEPQSDGDGSDTDTQVQSMKRATKALSRGEVYCDMLVMAGHKETCKFLLVVEVKSREMLAQEEGQILLQMVGPLMLQTMVFGLLINAREATFYVMKRDDESQTISWCPINQRFEHERDFSSEGIKKMFINLVALLEFVNENTEEIKVDIDQQESLGPKSDCESYSESYGDSSS